MLQRSNFLVKNNNQEGFKNLEMVCNFTMQLVQLFQFKNS